MPHGCWPQRLEEGAGDFSSSCSALSPSLQAFLTCQSLTLADAEVPLLSLSQLRGEGRIPGNSRPTFSFPEAKGRLALLSAPAGAGASLWLASPEPATGAAASQAPSASRAAGVLARPCAVCARASPPSSGVARAELRRPRGRVTRRALVRRALGKASALSLLSTASSRLSTEEQKG